MGSAAVIDVDLLAGFGTRLIVKTAQSAIGPEGAADKTNTPYLSFTSFKEDHPHVLGKNLRHLKLFVMHIIPILMIAENEDDRLARGKFGHCAEASRAIALPYIASDH
jgi:hypothetical protein